MPRHLHHFRHCLRPTCQPTIEPTIQPTNRAAWHAWGKLEDGAGRTDVARRLYQAVLHLDPRSVPALSALGCLERRAGDLAAAEARLEEALVVDSDHAPSVYELALVREAQVRVWSAGRLCRWALLGWVLVLFGLLVEQLAVGLPPYCASGSSVLQRHRRLVCSSLLALCRAAPTRPQS